jgi:lysophospholipase L1-like esterase
MRAKVAPFCGAPLTGRGADLAIAKRPRHRQTPGVNKRGDVVQIVAPPTTEALLDGHVDIRRRSGSFQPLRLPVDELGFYDPFTRWVASTTAGVRLRFASNTRALRLVVRQRLAAAVVETAPRPCVYDLYVDGVLVARNPADGGAMLLPEGGLLGDEHAVVAFNGLASGTKAIEIWLPQTATVSIAALEIDEGADIAPWPDQRARIVFHGSSITHCMEADGPSASWPAVACGLAGARLLNLGWGGSCLLSGLAARIVRDQPADGVVLKLGINVWSEGQLKERTFLDSAHSMISIIRERHVGTPLMIISPIYSPACEDAGSLGGLSLSRMRTLLAEVTEARIKAGDADIGYLSGLELFGAADSGDLPDSVHPNTAGYRRMGERFFERVLAPGTGAWAGRLADL